MKHSTTIWQQPKNFPVQLEKLVTPISKRMENEAKML